jgi:predicted acylesterase/phospholipase RssA
MPESTPAPLGDIALSLSGGGYRAAAFHLGTLRLLHEQELLPSVVGLSTVSGGTITGMAWTTSVAEGRTFAEFDARYAGWLRRTSVIENAVDRLADNRGERRGEWPSLIRAAAEVYAQPELLGDRRFGELLEADLPLREAIFNATEFNRGLAFRFRRSVSRGVHFGNRLFSVPREVAAHVRLADVVAASSCFPGGFEPIVFPQHFDWPATYPLERVVGRLSERFRGGLSLMDGGIYDNQGVDSLVLAFHKSDATTLVISDVSVPGDPLYTTPQQEGSRGWLTLDAVAWIARLLFVLAAASVVVLAAHGTATAREEGWTRADWFLYVIPGLATAGAAAALLWLRGRMREANRLIREHLRVNAWARLRRLTVPEFVSMVALRAGSLVALTSAVFMQRIRRLVYDGVYKDPAYEGRRMSNLIYGLGENLPKLFAAHPWLRPSTALRSYAEGCGRMPTTLWWENDRQMDALVRGGEATTCFTLLRFVVENRPAAEYEDPQTAVGALFSRLRAAWDEYQQWEPLPPDVFPTQPAPTDAAASR